LKILQQFYNVLAAAYSSQFAAFRRRLLSRSQTKQNLFVSARDRTNNKNCEEKKHEKLNFEVDRCKLLLNFFSVAKWYTDRNLIAY